MWSREAWPIALSNYAYQKDHNTTQSQFRVESADNLHILMYIDPVIKCMTKLSFRDKFVELTDGPFLYAHILARYVSLYWYN